MSAKVTRPGRLPRHLPRSLSRSLLAALAAGGVIGSVAIMLHGPPRLRPPRTMLPGFTAEETAGHLVVTSVRDGSSAQRAGLAPGDVVETLDGRPIRRLQDAALALRYDPHGAVRVGLVHAARHHDVTLRRREH
ncbi:PDZ domain-containing protein [Novosphingobium bradum]|uniref:PDZ domain-containing protein n=1 Tax=Novosphingobium bradum TaxID=1737444 RepID=A0ABV7IUX6_9SPHN